MKEESDFSQAKEQEKATEDKKRKDMLHNILNGPSVSRKGEKFTFPDVWIS